MNRTHRLVASALVTTLLCLAGTVASMVSVEAAGCSGYSCHGLDPVVEGCAVASTTSATGTEAIVQNRYSTNCNANWVRGALTQKGFADGASIYIEIGTTDSRGSSEFMCWPGPSNTGQLTENCSGATYRGTSFVYSDMVDGTHVTSAYVIVLDSSGDVIEVDEASQ